MMIDTRYVQLRPRVAKNGLAPPPKAFFILSCLYPNETVLGRGTDLTPCRRTCS